MKDIDRPERLYQLSAEGLPSEFPPPRTDEGDAAAAAVALAETVSRRRFLPGRRTAVAIAIATLVVAGLAAYLVIGGGSLTLRSSPPTPSASSKATTVG